MFRTFLNSNIVLLDGATGTLLQQRGIAYGETPETLNLTAPSVILDVHRTYIDAGADVLYANTFGANDLKLAGGAHTAAELIAAGVGLAKRAAAGAGRKVFAALDLGPTGKLVDRPDGAAFDQIYDAFKNAALAGEAAGADLAVIETMTDLNEMRAALLAVKENTKLPVLCAMTFEATGRTVMGVAPAAFAIVAEGLGADAAGVNCSLGPDGLLPAVRELAANCRLPIVVKANAGLPGRDGRYDMGADAFARAYGPLLRAGARVIGGCCGTDADSIRRLYALRADFLKRNGHKTARKLPARGLKLCSASAVAAAGKPLIVGERLNPTGKKLYKEALLRGDFGYAAARALEQEEAGAALLDLNVGIPGADETALMTRCMAEIGAVCPLPLQFDSSDADCIEAALRRYPGKAAVNSVNGDDETLERVLPLVKKYGAAVIGLTLDKRGIPENAAERLAIAEKIVSAADRFGIGRENVIIDPLTLTAAAEQKQAAETLKALRLIKRRLKVKTSLGISNVSFGLPARDAVNAAFLAAALENGLDFAMINPNSPAMSAAFHACLALKGCDEGAKEFIERFKDSPQSTVHSPQLKGNAECNGHFSLSEPVTESPSKERGHFSLSEPVTDCPSKENSPAKKETSDGEFLSGDNAQVSDKECHSERREESRPINTQSALLNSQFSIFTSPLASPRASPETALFQSVVKGLKTSVAAVRKLLETRAPMGIVEGCLIPALDEVGKRFEAGKFFLPQLLASAGSAKLAFEEIQKAMPQGATASKGTIILAVVRGDMHDIGKNIVKVVLENYGFTVIDLGKNVEPAAVADAAVRHGAKLVGLSALMTTTVAHMKETIAAVKAAKPDCKVMVGGAVLTADYAASIGADFYGRDAVASARYANDIFKIDN
ncbi:MAG: homocysteine S-methyltransferase family protein [Clostridiales bacterium]|jgi:5-methyltetrahydrofolate--homocysteine methyltransferase|nr:homocysteine S-methyltransferase family protein [Clostridiales bacterium]